MPLAIAERVWLRRGRPTVTFTHDGVMSNAFYEGLRAMAKYFTPGDAEALLPRIEPTLREIQAMRRELGTRERRAVEMQAKVMGNGHTRGDELAELRRELAALTQAITDRIADINALGVLVKDLDTGLIDFLALRRDQEVYLCWQLGEQGIGWWHEIEAGFSGRRPIEEF